ncbi:hypothetical protein INT44_005787, partial [Umbelopsis vinacea]
MFLLRRSALLAKHSARNVHPVQLTKPSLLALRPAPSMMLPSVTRRWLTSDVKDTTAASPINQEVDEETLDPEALAAIEADLKNMELNDEETDPDWFVDKVYEQDHPEYQQSDFVPLWQRRAAGDSSLSSAAEEMINGKKVSLPSVLALLEESKAENIGVIDMRSKCDWTDFMIVAESSRGERYLSSIADEVISVMGKAQKADPTMSSLPKPSVEGKNEGSDWLLVDAGPFIIHLFTPQARAQYDLEGLWSNVPDDPLLRVENSGMNADQLKEKVENSF